uniref:Secreted protein n=1 Tax=Ascaris lumbricoides TaxID=6252 RepID=A0A0M3HIY1_ASCLU
MQFPEKKKKHSSHCLIRTCFTLDLLSNRYSCKWFFQFSVCLTGLQRHVCGDVGADGYRGQPTYARVEISPHKKTATKTFTLRYVHI